MKTRPTDVMHDEEIQRLATFRGFLRAFHAFSEHAAHDLGLTSLQYQALLAIRAPSGPGPVTVKSLACSLLIKHNSAVGLADRIEQLGLAARSHSADDRRSVVLMLTPRGRRVLDQLAAQHLSELQRVAPDLNRHARAFARPVSHEPARRAGVSRR